MILITDNNKKSNNLEEFINLLHFMDLNIVDMLILELLLRHSNPLVRHTLYNELSEYLESFQGSLEHFNLDGLNSVEEKIMKLAKKKKSKISLISPSSFYNSLNNLEKRGFIKFNKDKKDKIKTIETTEYSSILIEKLARHFVNFIGLSNDFNYIDDFIDKIKILIGKEKTNSFLVIWLPFLFDMRILNKLHSVTERFFLFSRIQDPEELEDRGLKKIFITRIFEKTIREPNESFDIIAIPYYIDNKLFGMHPYQFLSEGYRVLKKGGFFIILIDRKTPYTKHNTLNRLGEIYNRANEDRLFNKNQIQDHLQKAEIEKYQFVEIGRQLVLIINK